MWKINRWKLSLSPPISVMLPSKQMKINIFFKASETQQSQSKLFLSSQCCLPLRSPRLRKRPSHPPSCSAQSPGSFFGLCILSVLVPTDLKVWPSSPLNSIQNLSRLSVPIPGSLQGPSLHHLPPGLSGNPLTDPCGWSFLLMTSSQPSRQSDSLHPG